MLKIQAELGIGYCRYLTGCFVSLVKTDAYRDYDFQGTLFFTRLNY